MSVPTDDTVKKITAENQDEMEAGPSFFDFDPSELKKITVQVDIKSSKRHKSNVKFDVAEIKPVRRKDEGLRPIFDRPEIKEFYLKKLEEKKSKPDSEASSTSPSKSSENKKPSLDFLLSVLNEKKTSEDSSRKRSSPSPDRRRGEKSRSRDRKDPRPHPRRGSDSRERRERRHFEDDRESRNRSGGRYSPDRSRFKRSRSRDRRQRSVDSSNDSAEEDKKKIALAENCNNDEIVEEGPLFNSNPNHGMVRHPWGPMRHRLPVAREWHPRMPFPPHYPPIAPVVFYPPIYAPYPHPRRMRGYPPR